MSQNASPSSHSDHHLRPPDVASSSDGDSVSSPPRQASATSATAAVEGGPIRRETGDSDASGQESGSGVDHRTEAAEIPPIEDLAVNTPSTGPGASHREGRNASHVASQPTTSIEVREVAAALEQSRANATSSEVTRSRPDNGSGKQHTLGAVAKIAGLGLFLGEHVNCEIHPAAADHGIVFERIDVDQPIRIPALVTNVTARSRRTTLKGGGVSVETIEHLMSAFAGLGIDNALVRLDGPELPAGDGSARMFAEAILDAGIDAQDAVRRYFRVREPITEEEGDAMIVALPHEQPDLQTMYELDYGDDRAIPRQVHSFGLQRDDYLKEICPSRTFSRLHEARALWDAGMCQHLTPKDVLVIGDDGKPVENDFRFENEPVRHKVLDLIGDLYLLGQPIQGRIVAYRSGHALNHRLVARMLDQLRSRERAEIVTGLDGPSMDIRSIMKLMRHRYPMLLVDRVVSVEGSKRAIGIKNVTINEPFFQGHYPGTPIMPGVLIVEAMAQLSGLLVSSVLEHTGKVAILLSLDGVKLRRPVVPGDQLVMEAETVRAQSRTAHLRCKAFVADQLAAEAQIKFIMVDAEQDERV
ncbi:MAG: UDP-3-O-acyl-N-acetylglucosamine deacetylase [Planctomycetota bacterium]